MKKLAERLNLAPGKAHPTPVAWRDEGGLMIGHDGSAWLYRVLPQYSLAWAEPDERQAVAEIMRNMFVELGRTSRAASMGTKIGANYRKFHLVSLSWNQAVSMPEGTPEALEEWLTPVFKRFRGSDSMVAIGVQLRKGRAARQQTLSKIVSEVVSTGMKAPPDPKQFTADRAIVSSILKRAGGRPPTDAEALRLETWWNGGKGGTSIIAANPDGRSISCDAWPEGLEMSALIGFEEAEIDNDLWVAEAFGHLHGCVVFSVRGELWPPKVARTQVRRTQRKADARIEDEADTGDLARDEDQVLRDQAKELEDLYTFGDEPLIRYSSFIFGRRASYSDETYAEFLERRYGLLIKAVEYRQVETLKETLPCAQGKLTRTAPYSQDCTVGVLAASGIQANTELGDEKGAWIGMSVPHSVDAWINPMGAAEQNKPPAMAVCGEPGAGKTFFLQLLATQAALLGQTVVMINPKPGPNSLSGFAHAIGGRTIRVSALEQSEGMLDPFSFAEEPAIAAEIATQHISCAVPLEEVDLIEVGAVMKNAAVSGRAHCVVDALRQAPPHARDMILKTAEADSLFRLGIADQPQEKLEFGGTAGLTLIEFDRQLPLPTTATSSTRDLELSARSAVAAVRLVCRAALEQMFANKGGTLILDEAHVFLSSKEGREIIKRLGREGRSQRILPVLSTQLIADVTKEDSDMGSYLGRVMVMKMKNEKEVAAALDLCGLEATAKRKEWLADAAPIRGEEGTERGALALHKDLNGRLGSLVIGPVPDQIEKLFSTNPLDEMGGES